MTNSGGSATGAITFTEVTVQNGQRFSIVNDAAKANCETNGLAPGASCTIQVDWDGASNGKSGIFEENMTATPTTSGSAVFFNVYGERL